MSHYRQEVKEICYLSLPLEHISHSHTRELGAIKYPSLTN